MLTYLEGFKLSPHICILVMWIFFQRFFTQWNKSEIATAAEGNRGSCSSNAVCFLILSQTFLRQLFVTLLRSNLFSSLFDLLLCCVSHDAFKSQGLCDRNFVWHGFRSIIYKYSIDNICFKERRNLAPG